MLVLSLPALARAQGGEVRPVEPNTGVEAGLDGSYETVGSLHGAQGGLLVAARVAPDPGLELGAGWGVRASGAWLDDGAARARGGLPPLRAWIGTGGAIGEWRLGLRLEGGVSPSLLDAPEASSNGEHGFLSLTGELAVATALYRARVALRVGAAYSGALAWAGIGTLRAGVELGPTTWRARPFVAVYGAVATDLGWSGRPALGAVFDLEAGSLAIELLGPGGATGELVTLVATWRLGLG